MSSLRFSALDPAALEARFSSASVTAFGGYPLWAQLLDRLRIEQEIVQQVKLLRGSNPFTAPELARFFIDIRVQGAERLRHVEEVRHGQVPPSRSSD
jgi:hypothetical protein